MLNMDLKSFNWKRHGNTFFKVLINKGNLGLLCLLGFTIYGITWDTVLRPGLEQIKGRDDLLKVQREALDEKGTQQKQYDQWEQQLKGLEQRLVPVPAGSSRTVISVSESSNILKLAKGDGRDAMLPILPAPHDRRDSVTLIPNGSKEMDLMEVLNPKTEGATSSAQPPPQKDSPDTVSAMVIKLPVEQFDYDLKVTATYPALVDLVNQLVLQKKLVKINKIVISRPATVTDEPDPKEFPDFPVPLDMILSLSIFLYDDNAVPGR